MGGGQLKAHELRPKSKDDLLAQLKELKNELGALRVAKVTGGAPNKLAKIKSVRKSIACVLTVINHNKRAALREAAKKKYMPLDLRQKKTRAARRALSVKQSTMKTQKSRKKAAAFPKRVYALKE
jgi:large subunit ribosomal protein L35e